jgi:cell division protein ZapB
MAKLEDLIERVERLLLRHDELKRTNALLYEQLEAVAHERDSLRSRLSAARGRIDALLERLPKEVSVVTAAAHRADAEPGDRAA